MAAVTSSGGAGIIAADRFEAAGLELPELAPETQEKLSRLVPDFGALANPVDVTAQLFNRDDRAFGDVCAIVSADPSVDALLVLVTMVIGDAAVALAEDLAAAVDGQDLPCTVVWLAGQDQTVEARALLGAAGIPVFSSIALAARVTAALVRGPRPESLLPPPPPLPAAPPPDPWALLDALGIDRPAGRLTRGPQEAAEAAAEIAAEVGAGVGAAVVMKAVAPGLEHKTEAGGVRLDVTADRAPAVFAELAAAVPGLDGVLVQRAVPAGLELLVGARGGREGWPPVLTVGLGGTGTEVHRDVATALAPVSEETALALLRELRSWPLLAGHRGRPARDIEAVVDVLVRVGHAVARWPRLAELEINPLIVGPAGSGAVAVDVLVDTRTPEEQ